MKLLFKITLLTSFVLMPLIVTAANLAFVTGPLDPSALVAHINSLTNRINTGVSGLLAAQGPVATATGTGEQVLGTYTMPPGTLANYQALRVYCSGTTGATANNKTRKIYFGSEAFATATEAANGQPWYLTLTVLRTGATAWSVQGNGLAGTAGITVLDYAATGSDADTGIVIKCTATDGTSQAGDVNMNAFYVEQVK